MYRHPGDRLILTKPLGTGVLATAIKGGMAAPETVAEAVGWMTMLSALAAAMRPKVSGSSTMGVKKSTV